MRRFVGIDLGGTSIAAGVVDERGTILHKGSIKTNTRQPFEDLVADIAKIAYQVVEAAGLEMREISSVGLGTPSLINPKTKLLVNANNLGWRNVPLPAELGKYFPIPLYIRNDADCAALGEVMAGAAKDCGNALMITLGTGLGGRDRSQPAHLQRLGPHGRGAGPHEACLWGRSLHLRTVRLFGVLRFSHGFDPSDPGGHRGPSGKRHGCPLPGRPLQGGRPARL